MADAPPTLDYADRDRRRFRHRLWLVALVGSAIACGVVGRTVYRRAAPAAIARWEMYAAQRDVDALADVAVGYTVGPVDANGSLISRAAPAG